MKTLPFLKAAAVCLALSSSGYAQQFYENTTGYSELNASSMGYPSQNRTFCDGVDRPKQQADCKFKSWDKLPSGTPIPGKVRVKKAPTGSGTPEVALRNAIDQAGLSYGLAMTSSLPRRA